MKVSKRDIQLLIGLLGVLVVVLTYFLVYTKYVDKTKALETQNVALKQQADMLETLNLQKDEFITKTKAFDKEIVKIASKYDAGHMREDEIMFIYEMEGLGSNDVVVPYINMSSQEPVISGSAVATDATGVVIAEATGTETTAIAAADNGIQLFKSPLDFGFTTSYAGFKKMMGYIYATGGRKSIDSVNLTFDSSTGQLAGTMLMNMYFMTGTNGVYTPASIPTMSSGVENIFRTADIYMDAAIEEAE